MQHSKLQFGNLLSQLQSEFDSLCALNEALAVQNHRLSMVAQHQSFAGDMPDSDVSPTLPEPSWQAPALPLAPPFRNRRNVVLDEGPPEEAGRQSCSTMCSHLSATASEQVTVQSPPRSIYTAITDRSTKSYPEIPVRSIGSYPSGMPYDSMGAVVPLAHEVSRPIEARKPFVCRIASRDGLLNKDLYIEFKRMCNGSKNTISAEEIFEFLLAQESSVSWERGLVQKNVRRKSWVHRHEQSVREAALKEYSAALRALNEEIATRRPRDAIDPQLANEMQANTYILMFKDPGLIAGFEIEPVHFAILSEICQIIINHMLARDIAAMTNVDQSLLHWKQAKSQREIIMNVLDILAGIIIVLNMATITCSLDYDPEWPGWDTLEVGFTGFFMVEIAARMSVSGFGEFWFGSEFGWNLFDMAVILLGVADFILRATAVTSSNTMANVTTMRVLRLLRVVKMVRVLRLRMMKELRLIVNGLFAGLRVIFWAFVFLFIFVLMIGIVLKQLLDSNEYQMSFQAELFGNLPKCMFTVFRCFVTNECISLDGRPLVPMMQELFGPTVIVFYVACYAFLTFGLFNLIMAIVVESTVEGGKADEVRRLRQRQQAHLTVAHTVQDLVKLLCTIDDDPVERHSARNSINNTGKRIRGAGKRLMHCDSLGRKRPLSSRISATRFITLVDDPRVRRLFDKLGVTLIDPTHYIEAFDANEDGMLSVAELVRGLLKLRGSVEKADIVATLTVARDMQKSVNHVEAMLLREGFNAIGPNRDSFASGDTIDRLTASLFPAVNPGGRGNPGLRSYSLVGEVGLAPGNSIRYSTAEAANKDFLAKPGNWKSCGADTTPSKLLEL